MYQFLKENPEAKSSSIINEKIRFMGPEILVPAVFTILSILCFVYANVSMEFLANQVMVRFARNGIMVLALLIPIYAGMGLNFSVTVGAMCAQASFIFALNNHFYGAKGILISLFMTLALSGLFGIFIGMLMNLVKGREMIATIMIGILANYLYQLIFMVGFGTIIPANNQTILLKSGIGINSMIDLAEFKSFFDQFLVFQVGSIKVPGFMLLCVFLTAGFVYYIINTPLGKKIQAVGTNGSKVYMVGISAEKTRIAAMVISMVMAGLGQYMFLQNMGVLNVYTSHLNTDIFSCAALLAGGATIKKANIRNAFVGILLLHTLFTLSPLAGQNLFQNVSLGEYFRSFIAYGVIAFALIMNMKTEKKGNSL